MLTETQKKYLFAIYTLWEKNGAVKSADVAKMVGVSKASTAAMTQKLCETGTIEKAHYGQIALTPQGVREANDLFTKYIVIRQFLQSRLEMDAECADRDAAAIVFHVSQCTTSRLTDLLLHCAQDCQS
jgi:DtxR family Mn-dependent transcriptional regulator